MPEPELDLEIPDPKSSDPLDKEPPRESDDPNFDPDQAFSPLTEVVGPKPSVVSAGKGGPSPALLAALEKSGLVVNGPSVAVGGPTMMAFNTAAQTGPDGASMTIAGNDDTFGPPPKKSPPSGPIRGLC